jgi:PAS domain S-box-containing protein
MIESRGEVLPQDTSQHKEKRPAIMRKDGGLDFEGVRSIVMDGDVLYTLKKALRADIGFLERDLMMKAGQDGAREFMSNLDQSEMPGEPLQAIEKMLGTYSDRGFGEFVVERFNPQNHVVEIRGNNLVEAWTFHERSDLQREPVCYYIAGALAGVCEVAFGEDGDLDIIAVETDCIAQGRKNCRFVVAPSKDMSRLVPTFKKLRESASEHGLRLNEEILLKNLELQNLNLSLERQIRKKAGELVRAEENYKSLVEISPDPILISDLDGFVLSINDPGVEMLGFESREDALTGIRMASLFIEKDADWSKIIWAIEKEGSVKGNSLTLVNKRGERIDCQISARFVDLPSGRCVESVIKNVTETRRLIHQIEEKRSESEVMKDVLSHDMTKYTTAALHIIEKLRRSPNLSESDKNALEIILKDIQAEFELASAVRDFCWLSMTQIDQPDARNLQAMISDSIEDTKRWYPNRKIKINYERKAEPQFVRGNPLTPRIFANILRYTVKSEPRDDVVIDVVVDAHTENGIAYWRAKFTTQGGQVLNTSKEAIFQRSADTGRSSGETDFALLLAQSIAKVSEGRVSVEGKSTLEPEQVTGIVVELPRMDERRIANIHAHAGR